MTWFAQICMGIKHVHDKNILHRDLKSQNVFLTKTNLIKLGDFGISRVLSNSQSKAHSVVGTPYYLAPELIRESPYSFSADIWSLGILLYEICALQPPFRAQNFVKLTKKIMVGQYPALPDSYSQELKDLVDKLLNQDQFQRGSINDVLALPFVQNYVKKVLAEPVFQKEYADVLKNTTNQSPEKKQELTQMLENLTFQDLHEYKKFSSELLSPQQTAEPEE